GEPLLDARETRALREVEEEDQVQGNRGRQDGVSAEEVDLDLHGLAEPSHNVYIVPALLGVAAGRVVLDPNLVEVTPVQLLVDFRLQDRVEHGGLGDLLAAEGAGIVEHFAVAVSEDVRRE